MNLLWFKDKIFYKWVINLLQPIRYEKVYVATEGCSLNSGAKMTYLKHFR